MSVQFVDMNIWTLVGGLARDPQYPALAYLRIGLLGAVRV